VLAVILQTAALSQLSVFGGVPDIAPLVVASVALLTGSLTGAVMGFYVGLLVDVALLQTLGVSSFVLIVIGHFAGRVRETSRDPGATLLPLPVGALATLGTLTMFSVLQFLLGVETPVSLELLRQIVSTVLINALIALPVHAAVRRLLGSAAADERRRRRRRQRPGLSPLIQP
jgi:rod shape-determining protein MreD